MAMAVTVPSMNPIDEARIAATRISLRRPGSQNPASKRGRAAGAAPLVSAGPVKDQVLGSAFAAGAEGAAGAAGVVPPAGLDRPAPPAFSGSS